MQWRLLYAGFASRHPEIRQQGFARCDARDWLLSQTDPQSLAGFVFLDRVDLLAAPGQALLLRTLKHVDLRRPGQLVIAASSETDLRNLARDGRFLNELALRLTSVRFLLPPLRERREDILPFATAFLERLSARYHLPPIVLTSGAIAQLLEHHWPGNLHELSNILESAVLECTNGFIRAEDLALKPLSSASLPMRTPELLNLDAVIHSHILHVLDLNRGNKLRTARQLGISRSTLYRLLEKCLVPAG
jgi:DNA-binding NtrC family response regulator